MSRDPIYLPPAYPIYTTHDRGGRPHQCEAMARYASDAGFRERVDRRTAQRIFGNLAALDCARTGGG